MEEDRKCGQLSELMNNTVVVTLFNVETDLCLAKITKKVFLQAVADALHREVSRRRGVLSNSVQS